MQLTKQQIETILKNAPKNADKTKILDGLIMRGYELEGVDTNAAKQAIAAKEVKETPQEEPGSISTAFKAGIDKVKEGYQEANSAYHGDSFLKNVGQAFEGATKIAAGAVESAFSPLAPVVKPLEKVVDVAVDNPLYRKMGVGVNSPALQDFANSKVGEVTERVVENVADLNTIAGTVTGPKVAGKITSKVSSVVDDLSARVPKLKSVPNFTEKATDFFSNRIDEKATTILKETPTPKFDEYLKIAEEAVTDPRKITPFGVAGDKIAEATKKLQAQTKSLSTQKKQIISQAKTGLADFSKETGQTILEVRRMVGGTKIGNEVINKLKKVKTKLDADKVIDEIQDMLYKGNKDLTIPVGSVEDKALRNILGSYNGKLKATLPESYTKLNSQISERIKIISSLNSALGEVVDGVSTRGSGLIKQFFSPSGRKAQELFEFIKENTGIDLAQDATLARFAMEMFDDARANALLEGIPKSSTGLVDKIIDITVDKTGLGEGIQKKVRKNTIDKARKLTKPKP